jgi:ACR3 family arsenite transporter
MRGSSWPARASTSTASRPQVDGKFISAFIRAVKPTAKGVLCTVVLRLRPPGLAPKRLNSFERYLSLWVGLCMLAGVLNRQVLPGVTGQCERMEFGAGSQINIPIAVLIWLMIVPMMMKVDFASIRNVGKKPRGLLVTLFVNWLVKPFSMALIAWLFFRFLFSAWIPPADADQYIAGCIILAAAPCTAMVFVWSYLTEAIRRIRSCRCRSTT